MAARKGVVSTGVSTANTRHPNRRACTVMGNLKVQYNGTVADDVMLSSRRSGSPVGVVHIYVAYLPARKVLTA